MNDYLLSMEYAAPVTKEIDRLVTKSYSQFSLLQLQAKDLRMVLKFRELIFFLRMYDN